MLVRETASARQTEQLAARLARALRQGDVVLVAGDLGTGKTTFVRGACRALGVHGPVTSPTFTIGHLYEGRQQVAHLDLYRFAGVSPAEWGDLEPYFDGTIAFVEWPQAGRGVLPQARASVTLEHLGADRRRVTVDAASPSLLEDLERADPGVRHGN